MRWRSWAAGMLTALAVVVSAQVARAAGNEFLVRDGGAKTLTLGFGGGVNTVPVHGYRYSYHRPYAYGFGRPYSYSFYRPYAYSFYRPYAFNYYRPYRYSYYYPRYYGFNFGFNLYRPYYYAPLTYSYSYPGVPYYDYSYCPTGGGVSISASLLTTNPQVFSLRPYTDALTPPPAPNPAEQTYPYNGDPQHPVPMPKTTPDPTAVPPPAPVVEGRLVSAPAKPARAFPAYGDVQERFLRIEDPIVRQANRAVRLPR